MSIKKHKYYDILGGFAARLGLLSKREDNRGNNSEQIARKALENTMAKGKNKRKEVKKPKKAPVSNV